MEANWTARISTCPSETLTKDRVRLPRHSADFSSKVLARELRSPICQASANFKLFYNSIRKTGRLLQESSLLFPSGEASPILSESDLHAFFPEETDLRTELPPDLLHRLSLALANTPGGVLTAE